MNISQSINSQFPATPTMTRRHAAQGAKTSAPKESDRFAATSARENSATKHKEKLPSAGEFNLVQVELKPICAAVHPFKPPEQFVDAVTLEIMTDPVLCNDGRTYERSTAELGKNSPVTARPLEILMSNAMLRDKI